MHINLYALNVLQSARNQVQQCYLHLRFLQFPTRQNKLFYLLCFLSAVRSSLAILANHWRDRRTRTDHYDVAVLCHPRGGHGLVCLGRGGADRDGHGQQRRQAAPLLRAARAVTPVWHAGLHGEDPGQRNYYDRYMSHVKNVVYVTPPSIYPYP